METHFPLENIMTVPSLKQKHHPTAINFDDRKSFIAMDDEIRYRYF